MIHRMIALGASLMVSACVTGGPLSVIPDREFAGVADALEGVGGDPDRGALHVFIVHGMGVRSDQSGERRQDAAENCALGGEEAVGDVVHRALIARLELSETPVRRCVLRLGGNQPPDLLFRGQPIWQSPSEWRQDAPRLEITEHRSLDGRHAVVFYGFNYWRALARLKCREVVAPDRMLVGESAISRECRTRFPDMLASEPEPAASALPFNRRLKTELVSWGLADAVLATSDVRSLIRAAFHEAMQIQVDYAQRRLGAPIALTMQNAPDVSQALADQRWVIISKSLGSYLMFDAFADAIGLEDGEFEAASDANAEAATLLTICSANQIHMLANQVPLLRLSEIRRGSSGEQARITELSSLLAECAARGLLHRPIQVVAYHDPNDPLTFLLPPGGADAMETTNVIAPFAPVIIPLYAADPVAAHQGQELNNRILELIAFGYPSDRSGRRAE